MWIFLLAVTFDDLRAVLEVLSFIATIALGALGFFALSQLRIARSTLVITNKDMQTRIDREAIVLAAQQADRFAEMISETSDIWDEAEKAGVATPDWELNNYLFDPTSLKDPQKAENWRKSLPLNISNQMILSLNKHESFAIYFVGGAANDEIVYDSIASIYCSHLRRVAPILVEMRFGQLGKDVASGPYRNAIELFVTWSARLESNALIKEQEKLAAAQEGIHTSKIPVYGSSNRD